MSSQAGYVLLTNFAELANNRYNLGDNGVHAQKSSTFTMLIKTGCNN